MRTAWGALLATGALWASAAQAVMPPEVYQRARDEAPFHLEVEVISVTTPEADYGVCQVWARVVMIARDTPGRISLGQELGFGVDCVHRDADPNAAPDGPLFEIAEDLQPDRRLDVYLEGSAWGGFSVPAGQVGIIDDGS